MVKPSAVSRFHRPPVSAVDVRVARHALWLMGDQNLGEDGGDFATRLWRLLCCADQANLDLLRTLYPGMVEAFGVGMRTSWGPQWLREKVLDARVSA